MISLLPWIISLLLLLSSPNSLSVAKIPVDRSIQGMANAITSGAISTLLSNPSPNSSDEAPKVVVQVVDLKPVGSSNTRFTFMASDGERKIKSMLPTFFSSEIHSGKLQNLGLIRILCYTCNLIPNQPERCLIITECEVVSPALEAEIKCEVKTNVNEIKVKAEETGIMLKPKQESLAKSAAQIMYDQKKNFPPAERLAMTRRVHPLVSLNPYQGFWTIKVRVTNKGILRTYKNMRGDGRVFNVELTDEDGTQIQATMFNGAATKFFPKFELGKVYYISKGSLKFANKQFKTVQNDYEMTLHENSEVEEAIGEGAFVPETKFNFVPIDQLGPYINGRELVDIIGVVQNVSNTLSIRRKADNETIPKREITIADESKKIVTISLWNDHATTVGQELLNVVDTAPIVAIKGLKVGDFQGVSLSTISKSTVVINPDVPQSIKLRSWFDSEGKGVSMVSLGSTINSGTLKAGARSFYSNRVFLSHIIKDLSLGQDKPVFFNIKVYISLIKPDQAMWYRACKTCNKKVIEAVGSRYWCETCQKNDEECSLRYIMVMKVADASGEAWISVFNEHAEKIVGCSADELNEIKMKDEKEFQMKLKEATWVPHLFLVSVTQTEYMNEKRQRITIRSQAPVDWAAESKYLMEEMTKMKLSS